MRRVLKYPGSKWNIAKQIVTMIPEHHSYVEPFFGSGAVLFNKPESDIEMVNDLDCDVVNLFQCIKEDSEKLARLIMTTPYSREMYDSAFKVDPVVEMLLGADRFHKACQFLVRCWQGYGFRTIGSKVGWRNDVVGREKAYALWEWYRLPEWIIEVAERLRKVQIENRPALEVIKRFNHKGVFMYLDPPYLWETRNGKQYKHEMSDDEHEDMLKSLLQSEAEIMISGYDSEMYNDYLKGWKRVEIKSCAEQGKPRTEVIWMNYGEVQMRLEDFL